MTLAAIITFAIAYSLKGGWIFKIPQYAAWHEKRSDLFKKIFSCKLQAAIVVFLFALFMGDYNPFLIVMAWILAVSPPIRDEALSVGRIGHWSGVFKDAGYSRQSSIVKAVQRGAWMGAVFTVIGFPSLSIVIMAFGFPVAYFLAQEAYYRIHKIDSWTYAEPMVGALIGVCYALNIS
jgi:hypothetical protein